MTVTRKGTAGNFVFVPPDVVGAAVLPEELPPSCAVTLEARSPILAYIQLPGQLLLANQRWTVSTISSDFGL